MSSNFPFHSLFTFSQPNRNWVRLSIWWVSRHLNPHACTFSTPSPWRKILDLLKGPFIHIWPQGGLRFSEIRYFYIVSASKRQFSPIFVWVHIKWNSRSSYPPENWLKYKLALLGAGSDLPDQSVTFVWILIRTNIRIYSCQENDTNEYPNIFVWNFLRRTNIRIYLYQNFDTNKYPNKYLDRKYSNIRIYSSLSGLDLHQFRAFTI